VEGPGSVGRGGGDAEVRERGVYWVRRGWGGGDRWSGSQGWVLGEGWQRRREEVCVGG